MAWLHAVLDVPPEWHEDAARLWSGALGWRTGEPWEGHPELRSFEPDAGAAYVHLQQVDGPPRVHLDVEVDDPEATGSRAGGLGATFVAEHDRWTTWSSPGGLPFCLLRPGDQDVPDPVTWPGGHRNRLVQVCIDSPGEAHEIEVAFWRALLGGRWVDSDAPEFAGKWHDDGSPLQLLFQRLDDPVGPVRAHLDLGTDDLPGEVARLRALGAEDVAPGRGWHVLRDVTGMVFCATLNSPEGSTLRDLG